MKYWCILCGDESITPMCFGCKERRIKGARGERLSYLPMAKASIGVPATVHGVEWNDDWVKLFAKNKGSDVLLAGTTDKTEAAAAALVDRWLRNRANAVRAEDQHWYEGCKWRRVESLLTEAREAMKGVSVTEDLFLRSLNAKLLVVSGLGDENITEWSARKLHDVLLSRKSDGLATVATTRHAPKDLANLYGETGSQIVGILADYHRVKP